MGSENTSDIFALESENKQLTHNIKQTKTNILNKLTLLLERFEATLNQQCKTKLFKNEMNKYKYRNLR